MLQEVALVPQEASPKCSMDPVHEHHRHLRGAATPTEGFAGEAMPAWQFDSSLTGKGKDEDGLLHLK